MTTIWEEIKSDNLITCIIEFWFPQTIFFTLYSSSSSIRICVCMCFLILFEQNNTDQLYKERRRGRKRRKKVLEFKHSNVYMRQLRGPKRYTINKTNLATERYINNLLLLVSYLYCLLFTCLFGLLLLLYQK